MTSSMYQDYFLSSDFRSWLFLDSKFCIIILSRYRASELKKNIVLTEIKLFEKNFIRQKFYFKIVINLIYTFLFIIITQIL